MPVQDKSKYYRDSAYQAAILVAPALWGILLITGNTHIQLDWMLLMPWAFLMLCVIQPILEEWVFRGLFQGYLMEINFWNQSFWGISFANIAVATIFILLHLIYHPMQLALLVFIPALLFGYFRDRFQGRLLPSMVLHCFYNTGYFILYPPNL